MTVVKKTRKNIDVVNEKKFKSLVVVWETEHSHYVVRTYINRGLTRTT